MICTLAALVPKVFARNLTHDRLAAPSTGGEVKRILRAPLCSPEISFRDALGCNITANRIPFLTFLMSKDMAKNYRRPQTAHYRGRILVIACLSRNTVKPFTFKIYTHILLEYSVLQAMPLVHISCGRCPLAWVFCIAGGVSCSYWEWRHSTFLRAWPATF